MKVSLTRLQRTAVAGITAVFAAAGLVPALSGTAYAAYGQVTDRYVKLGTSVPGATNVSYEIGFKTATNNTNLQAIIVDFCNGATSTPIIGDTCAIPTGFSVGASPSVTTTGGVNTGLGAGAWTASNQNTNRTLEITNAGGPANVAAGTQVKFTLTTATNPSTTGTFYARIFTFVSPGNATTWLVTGDGSATATVNDAGGAALSTAQQITVTSKVQETLSFCVYTGGSCGVGSAVTLGSDKGVLSTAGPFVDKNTQYDVQTNAQSGVDVAAHADHTLQSTSNPSNTITAITAAPAASNPSNEQFGLCSIGTGTTPATDLVAVDNYDGTNGGTGTGCSTQTSQSAGTAATGGAGTAQFYFPVAVTSTYGDPIAHSPAGPSKQGTVAFMANIANTTEAGIYNSHVDFIATGTY